MVIFSNTVWLNLSSSSSTPIAQRPSEGAAFIVEPDPIKISETKSPGWLLAVISAATYLPISHMDVYSDNTAQACTSRYPYKERQPIRKNNAAGICTPSAGWHIAVSVHCMCLQAGDVALTVHRADVFCCNTRKQCLRLSCCFSMSFSLFRLTWHTNNSCLKIQQDKKSVFTTTSVFTVLHQVYRYKKPAQWRVPKSYQR